MVLRLNVRDRDGVEVVRVDLELGKDLVLGRDPASDVVLGSAGVSRRHARLQVRRDSVQVIDEISATGVRVGGKPIEGRAVLRAGDSFQIGEFTLSLEEREETAAPGPPTVVAGPTAGPAAAPGSGTFVEAPPGPSTFVEAPPVEPPQAAISGKALARAAAEAAGAGPPKSTLRIGAIAPPSSAPPSGSGPRPGPRQGKLVSTRAHGSQGTPAAAAPGPGPAAASAPGSPSDAPGPATERSVAASLPSSVLAPPSVGAAPSRGPEPLPPPPMAAEGTAVDDGGEPPRLPTLNLPEPSQRLETTPLPSASRLAGSGVFSSSPPPDPSRPAVALPGLMPPSAPSAPPVAAAPPASPLPAPGAVPAFGGPLDEDLPGTHRRMPAHGRGAPGLPSPIATAPGPEPEVELVERARLRRRRTALLAGLGVSALLALVGLQRGRSAAAEVEASAAQALELAARKAAAKQVDEACARGPEACASAICRYLALDDTPAVRNRLREAEQAAKVPPCAR